jgi:epoxyqueuosine reductase
MFTPSSEAFKILGIHSLASMDHDFARYRAWLDQQMHAGMEFMAEHQAIRKDPALLLEGARSAILVGLRYPKIQKDLGSQIAAYAHARDYHKVLRQFCESYLRTLKQEHTELEYRIVVDTAPLFERAMFAKATDGYIGKNTMYIHKHYGSFVMLAAILVTVELNQSKFDTKETCGGCRRCQVFCPTGALDQDYVLDARKCLSYWTIEHRGLVPLEYWQYFGQYYFGCDICQNVCPKNRGRVLMTKPKIVYNLFDVFRMDQTAYVRMFAGTALTRAKKDGLRRNALIAMVAVDHPDLKEALKLASQDQNIIIRKTAEQASAFRKLPDRSPQCQ